MFNLSIFLWKILRTLLLSLVLIVNSVFNLYAGQEATVRTGHGIKDWFQIGKGVYQGCILSPCLFNLIHNFIILIVLKSTIQWYLLGWQNSLFRFFHSITSYKLSKELFGLSSNIPTCCVYFRIFSLTPKGNPVPIKQPLLIPLFPQPLPTTNLFSVFKY